MKLTKTILVVMVLAVATTSASTVFAAPHLDRIEDRVDRRESRRDEAVDHGPLDVIEDVLDRREDRRDRRNNYGHGHHAHRGHKGPVIIVHSR